MPRATIGTHAPDNSTAALLENILSRNGKPYGYSDERQGGYYEECYSSDQGGSYYDPDCFDYSYDAQDYYANENSETCVGDQSEVDQFGKKHQLIRARIGKSSCTSRGRKEKEQEPTDFTPAAGQTSSPLQILTVVRQKPPSQPSPIRTQIQSFRQQPLHHFVAVRHRSFSRYTTS
ncbi:hypothetical protein SASPL_111944 [Salvia splendens]|uniref:Uncharacterized protein n=1 Tax=Salvia splendens TaxID=180675 RepID=A0A8X8YDH6_SALSN|nr:hypothetical protein SASPL_111944 [Salvia splendens]